MTKYILVFSFVFLTAASHAQVMSEKFDSKGHPKAKGAWFTVRYPGGWNVKEGERPNMVKLFNGEYRGYFTNLMVQVIKADAPVESECKSSSASEMAQSLTNGDPSTLTSHEKKITHEGKPGFIIDHYQKMQRAGISFGVANRIMMICQNDKFILLWCGNTKVDKIKNTLSSSLQELEIAEPVCRQFFNSLVLMDNY